MVIRGTLAYEIMEGIFIKWKEKKQNVCQNVYWHLPKLQYKPSEKKKFTKLKAYPYYNTWRWRKYCQHIHNRLEKIFESVKEVDKIEFVGGPKYLWTTELQIENFIPDSLIRM